MSASTPAWSGCTTCSGRWRPPGKRGSLVRLYLDVDDRRVFAALEHLDDLRAFAAYVVAQP